MVGGPEPPDPLSPLDPSTVPSVPGTARGWIAVILAGTLLFAMIVWFVSFLSTIFLGITL